MGTLNAANKARAANAMAMDCRLEEDEDVVGEALLRCSDGEGV
jgi:hypothetical protein